MSPKLTFMCESPAFGTAVGLPTPDARLRGFFCLELCGQNNFVTCLYRQRQVDQMNFVSARQGNSNGMLHASISDCGQNGHSEVSSPSLCTI